MTLLKPGFPKEDKLFPSTKCLTKYDRSVTGGHGALGHECGLAMLEHGIEYLGIIDLKSDATKLETLSKRGGRVSRVQEFIIDLSQDDSAEKALEFFCKTFPRLDIVLCCAGIVGAEHALETTALKWRRMQDINTTSAFLIAQASAKRMIEFATKREEPRLWCGASIILISSIPAHHVNFPQPQVAYNVSKAGISHMARCLAAEWAVHGIRVNSISPGYMNTALNVGEHLDQAKKVWYARTPMGRMGRPDEIAGVVVMLSSPAGSYITGSDIVVDGKLELDGNCYNDTDSSKEDSRLYENIRSTLACSSAANIPSRCYARDQPKAIIEHRILP